MALGNLISHELTKLDWYSMAVHTSSLIEAIYQLCDGYELMLACTLLAESVLQLAKQFH